MRRTLLILVVLMVACQIERRTASGPDYQIRQVFVVPDTATVEPLGDVQFQAYARTMSDDSVGVLVSWSTNFGSISSDAVYTADTSENDATVMAQLGGGPDAVPLVGTARVQKKKIVALLLTPAVVTLPPGRLQQFSTRAVRAAGDTVSIAPQYTATGGTITSSGVYTAGPTAGTYRVIASRKSGLFDTATVTIAQVSVNSVSVNPPVANVPLGGVAQLTVTTRDAAGNVLTGRSVTWSSEAPGVASVSPEGLVSGIAAGSATITATSEGQTGSAVITVVMVPVAAVTVSPATANLRVGTSELFIATVEDSAGNLLSGRTITWSSDAPSVASVLGDGFVTANAVGTATITATSEGKNGSASLTVSVVPVASVTVTPPSAGLRVGTSVQLTATARDSTSNVLVARSVTWSSSAPAVATVSASGRVTAAAPGSATITATSEGQTGTATIAASVVPVSSVTVAPTSATLRVGGAVQLSATTKDSANNVLTGRTVTWSSSATSVATVSAGGVVTGVGTGSATITATSEGRSASAAITVTVVPVATVALAPTSALLRVGDRVQLSATPKDSAGNVLTGRTVSWASNAVAVATVSSSGLVTAVAPGSASITATSEGKSATATVTVALAPVSTVTVTPSSAGLVVGATQQLNAVTKDSAGNVLIGRTVTWTTSAAGVATVSSNGVVTAVAVGSATITATSEGKTGTSAITVTAAGSGCASKCRYVSVTGNDNNAGTSAAPWRTIQHAADVANPGDTVVVNDGVYTGGFSVVNITRSGTASAWIVFRAANKWRAIIDGQNFSSTQGIEIGGNYIRVEGFEVRGTSRVGIEPYGGREDIAGNHDVVVTQNHVHDIGHICTGSTGGIVGIAAYSDNLVIERNVIHDIGRLGPGEQGCVEPNPNWQNHDHGIYNGVGNNVVIRNNLFYNFTHGWAIQRYNGAGSVTTGLTIVNNTFAFPNPWRDGHIIIATTTNNLVIANNLFYQPTTAGVWFDGAGNGATVAGNISTNTIQTGGTGLSMSANMPNTDPLFLNAAGLNFHLTTGSPARGQGVATWCPATDLDGVARSGTCTAGAYQN